MQQRRLAALRVRMTAGVATMAAQGLLLLLMWNGEGVAPRQPALVEIVSLPIQLMPLQQAPAEMPSDLGPRSGRTPDSSVPHPHICD